MRAIIVDDEALAREYLRGLLEREPDIEVVAECADIREATEAVGAHVPDLLFLDVQLRRENGFDLLTQLPGNATPVVVFVTAFDEYAVKAFEVHALDYLLKPFDAKRLQATLERVRAHVVDGHAAHRRVMAALAAMQAPPAPSYVDRLLVTEEGRTYFVLTSAIESIEASHNHAVLHTAGQQYRLREPLASLEQRLDPWRFVRIHRSTIVNVDFIREMQPWFRGETIIIMKSGQRWRVGRTYRNAWDRWQASNADGRAR